MLTTSVEWVAGNAVLRMSGVLNAGTYRQARDAVTKAALDGTSAVIVDVDDLRVPDDGAWSVFVSARWRAQHWPLVAIALSSGDPTVRRRLAQLSIPRYVPVFADVAAAAQAITDDNCRYRRRARIQLTAYASSLREAQAFVSDNLELWSMSCLTPVTVTVAGILVENALDYTLDGCDLRLEATGAVVFIAASDTSAARAVRRESPPGSPPTGLDIVATLCARWGNIATPTGKTVWALIDRNDVNTSVAGLIMSLDTRVRGSQPG